MGMDQVVIAKGSTGQCVEISRWRKYENIDNWLFSFLTKDEQHEALKYCAYSINITQDMVDDLHANACKLARSLRIDSHWVEVWRNALKEGFSLTYTADW